LARDASETSANAFEIVLNVLTVNSFDGTSVLGGGFTSGGSPNPVNSGVEVGYQFGENAILAGLGLVITSGTTVGLTVTPTYRRYLPHLAAAEVVPYIEGVVGFGIVSPPNHSTNFSIAVGPGAGVEWFFTKRLAVIAGADVFYTHANTGPNTDAVGLAGQIGLALHI
jgi:hypothetical protein